MKTKLGMRIIKTGIGIYLSLVISSLLGFENGSIAAITTVVGLQPSLQGSLNTIKNHVLATILGGTIAIITSYFFPGHALPIAITAVVTIWVCIHLGWQDSISLAVVTLILISVHPGEEYLKVISNRGIMILIGLSVAFSLNFTLPPQHIPRLKAKTDELRKAFEDLYIEIIDDLIVGYLMETEELETKRRNIKVLLEESWTIHDLAVESNIKYIAKEPKKPKHILYKAINTIEDNLERSMEIHNSIKAILSMEHHPEINEKVHNYLHHIYIFHQEAFRYILSDTKEDDFTEIDFHLLKQELLVILDPLKGSSSFFEPFNYYTILMEGERIINEVKLLVEEKRREHTQNQKGDS
ncbi:MAG: hypothetical protein GX923_06505 [Clostridia bacterium]|nr:hypothetical protein [Clostridia bacterium]